MITEYHGDETSTKRSSLKNSANCPVAFDDRFISEITPNEELWLKSKQIYATNNPEAHDNEMHHPFKNAGFFPNDCPTGHSTILNLFSELEIKWLQRCSHEFLEKVFEFYAEFIGKNNAIDIKPTTAQCIKELKRLKAMAGHHYGYIKAKDRDVLYKNDLSMECFEEAEFVITRLQSVVEDMFKVRIYQKNYYFQHKDKCGMGLDAHKDEIKIFPSKLVSLRVQGNIDFHLGTKQRKVRNPNLKIKLREGMVLILNGLFRFLFKHEVIKQTITDQSISVILRDIDENEEEN